MPKLKLTDATVRSLKAPERGRIDYFDATLPGFALRVSGPTPSTPEGRKGWVVFYRFGGKQKRLTIEPGYPALGLADARKQAGAAFQALARGEDPAAAKQEAKTAARQDPAIAEAAAEKEAQERKRGAIENVIEDFIKRHLEAKHRAPRYIAETRRLFKLHVLPRWRGRELRTITRRDVIELLDEIADRGTPIAANRTRAAISAMCNFAIRRGIVPAAWASPVALTERPGAETKRERALSPAEIAAVWTAAGELGYPFGPYFLMLLATAQRREEVARMRWADIDLAEKTWTIPSDMTKPGRAHVVPLSPLALRLLERCPRSGAHVFTGRRGRRHRVDGILAGELLGDAPISGYSKAKRMLDEKIAAGETAVAPWTIHDLRRTAATMIAKLGAARFTLSRILNHADQSVTGIYDRHEYLPEKRQALDAWGQFLDNLTSPTPAANVVRMRREA